MTEAVIFIGRLTSDPRHAHKMLLVLKAPALKNTFPRDSRRMRLGAVPFQEGHPQGHLALRAQGQVIRVPREGRGTRAPRYATGSPRGVCATSARRQRMLMQGRVWLRAAARWAPPAARSSG
jgi:hypothetical protein